MARVCGEREIKYPYSTNFARELLSPFPSLAECGFSAVNDLLLKEKELLQITKRREQGSH